MIVYSRLDTAAHGTVVSERPETLHSAHCELFIADFQIPKFEMSNEQCAISRLPKSVLHPTVDIWQELT